MSCDSAHKTLPVLTGGAYLHLSAEWAERVGRQAKKAMELFGSTSPSYLILQSLDLCNRYLAEGYREKLQWTIGQIGHLRGQLKKQGWTVMMDSDPLKLTIFTGEKGYREAGAIAGGVLVDDTGGGVCQTSSTLFNAVVRADLEIVKRSAHSWPSSYVNKGEDATVNWPSLDFVFRNNGDYPVFVIAWYENQTVTVQIYGRLLPNGQTVDLESEVIKTIKPDDAVLYTLDASLPVGTRKAGRKKRTGYVVDTYKVYKDASGNVTEKKKLWTTTYRAMQDEILYNDGSSAASNE